MRNKLLRCIAAAAAIACIATGGAITASCTGTSSKDVAMITDYGDITDQSFNQSAYEACKKYCEANSLTFQYYKPAANTTAGRSASIEQAIDEGYKTIVMPGYSFGYSIVPLASKYPNVKFIGLDVSQDDLNEANGSTYTIPSNVVVCTYSEEISGFLAGYAAVKEGYKHLGFLGGMDVPAVNRFGYGFVQGADAAATEDSVTGVTMEYQYSGSFVADAKIKTEMSTWYDVKGVEVVFACGGGIFTSVCDAAKESGVDKKIIGVDSDQSYTINKSYGEDRCLTSAMKGLDTTIQTILEDIYKNSNTKWNSTWGGTATNWGIVSATSSENYVNLPTETWSMTKFTVNDYNELVKRIYNGNYTILRELESGKKTPDVKSITVNFNSGTIV